MNRDTLKFWIPVAILAGLLIAGGATVLQWFYTSERFLPGVEIAGLKVEGMTRQEAAAQLQKKAERFEKIKVHFFKDDFSYDTYLSRLCVPPDVSKSVEDVWTAEQQRGFFSKLRNLSGSTPVVYQPALQYQEPVIKSMVDEWNGQLGNASQDARIEIDANKGLIIIPEKPGRGVRADRIVKELPQQWVDFPSTIDILLPIEDTDPHIKASDLQGMGELSTYTTQFKTYEINRSSNLRLAASSINGQMVAPGAVFSFNDTVGERTVKSGYREAYVIVGSKFEPGLGGGVCQVSSTLYNSVLLAGMEIVERHNHGLAITYVPIGLDATVSYGVQDFQFKNTTTSPIYIRAATNGGELTISIYGNLKDKVNVKLTHYIDGVIGYGETREVSPDLAPGEERVQSGGAAGYTSRAYRQFLDGNGNVIKEELLSEDYYRPLNRIVLVGSGGGNASDAPSTKTPGQSGSSGPGDSQKPQDATRP